MASYQDSNEFVLTSASSTDSPYMGVVTVSNIGLGGYGALSQSNGTSTINIGTGGAGYYAAPITVASGGNIYLDPEPPSEMKSKPISTAQHAHEIQCRLRVETTKVISEYFCHHCQEVLFSKVISKIPKSIINKQCLPRIVKGV